MCRLLAAAALVAAVIEESCSHSARRVSSTSGRGHDASRCEGPTTAWLTEVGPVVRDRLSDQAAAHWREFSVIIAGGSTAVAIGVAGLLFAQTVDPGSRVLIGGMLLASVAGFTLAYFSIQIGSLVVVGPLTFLEVVTSFAIAAPQVAMPLWLGYVLRQHPDIYKVGDVLSESMHWFGIFACFAAAASIANFYESRRRKRAGLPAPTDFESAQLTDRVGAFVNGIASLGVWMMLRDDVPWKLAAGLVYLEAGILVAVMANQSRTIRALVKAVTVGPAAR
jgi:hypothetical protein